jgi:hypothetical protein
MVGWEVKVMRIIDEDDLIHEVLGELSLVDGDR